MQATVDDLLSELAQKSSQLVDAERRFSELEAMMQRIASRTGQGQLVTEQGLTALRSSVTGNGLCQLQRQCFEDQPQHQHQVDLCECGQGTLAGCRRGCKLSC